MAVRVRLTRVGSKKNPIWRVVVADSRSPRDGRFIETIGQYNPQTDPSTIRIDAERLEHWVARGAQASNTVKQLMKAQAKSGGPTPEHTPAPPPAVEVDEEAAAEAVADVAVTADAIDEPVPAEAEAPPPGEPAPEASAEQPADGAETADEPADATGDEQSS
jgi:small subunit ribosomal protein S16